MKNFLFILLLMPFAAIAQVDWFANPSSNWTNHFRNFDTQQNRCSGSSNPSISTTSDGTFGTVWKINKPRNRQRAELARTDGFMHPEGRGRFYGWRFKINAVGSTITQPVTVFQWKTEQISEWLNGRFITTNGDQNYPLNMEYSNGNLTLNYFAPCTSGVGSEPFGSNREQGSCTNFPSQRKTAIKTVSVPEGRWVEIGLKIFKSSSTSSGYVEFYFNGTRQTLNNGRTRFNGRMSDGIISSQDVRSDNVYPKWGAYNGNACNYNIDVFFDEMRVGRSYNDVDPDVHDSGSNNSGGSNSGGSNWPEISPGKTIWSSSQWSSSYQANRANDGNFSTWWASQQYYYDNNYIAYDLGGHYDVKKIKLAFSGAKMNKFRIWGNNGSGWFQIGVYNNPYTNPTVDNLNTTVRWISVQAIEQAYSWVDLYEFDVFGNYLYGKQANNKPDTSVGAPPAFESKVIVEKSIKVYPNPVTDNFSINLKNISEAEVTITDMLGKVVYKTTTKQSIIRINKANNFKTGMYIVNVKDENDISFKSKLLIK